MIQAFYHDGVKSSTVTFADHKLPIMQAKYGEALRIVGKPMSQQPAATGLNTVTSWPQERLPPRPARNREADKRGGRRPDQGKAVVCITTGVYFDAVADAARLYNLEQPSISAHLNHPKKHKQVKKHTFRWATIAEMAIKQVINS